jgi:hypothetical protein
MIQAIARQVGPVTLYNTAGGEFAMILHPNRSGRWFVSCFHPAYAKQERELLTRRECIRWIESVTYARAA